MEENNLELSEREIKVLENRAVLYRKLAQIQSKNGIPALSLLQYYAKKKGIEYDTVIDDRKESQLVKSCNKGNKELIESVKSICKYCNLNEDEQENFYRLILDNGNICDYFLSNSSQSIIKKMSKFNCAENDKMIFLIKLIEPEFDFGEYFSKI